MRGYAVRVDEEVKDVTIHKHPCGHIRKRGGWRAIWEDFNTLEETEKYAREWKAKGHSIKYCAHCMKYPRRG
jgi:hypothetical protein